MDIEDRFLTVAVDAELADDELVVAWTRALAAVRSLRASGSWGSKPRRDKFRAIARDPVLLAAFQGAVANTDPKADLPVTWMAPLVVDGSDASVDALVGHLDRALLAKSDRLDYIAMLRVHAKKTAALNTLLGEVDATIRARDSQSPALALGPVIGIGHVDPLWFRIWFEGTDDKDYRWEARIEIDSRKPNWHWATITSPQKWTTFGTTGTSVDRIGIGYCTPAEFPAWLARAAAKLGLEWTKVTANRSCLRGKKRDRVVAWLRGS